MTTGEGNSFLPAKIQNISAAGLTVVLDCLVTIGTVVTVELTRKARQVALKRQMRIVYIFKEPAGDFMLGGSFLATLTESDMSALL
jgi:hypothetical protein